jgi:DNA-binding beta-propeller fold protein YncE
VRLAQDKDATTEVLKIRNAERLGPISIDTEKQRLFVTDTGSARVFVIDLNERTTKTIKAAGLEEARALAWDPATRRLYVADSGGETISSARNAIGRGWNASTNGCVATRTTRSSSPSPMRPGG